VRQVTDRTLRPIFWALVDCMVCLFPCLVLSQQPVELKPSQTIQRSLHGGETHIFQISLTSGQFLYASVEQEGIDVEVTLLGPKGEKISRVDSSNGAWGPEPVVAIAESSGMFRLQVRPGDSGAPSGQYEARIVELREATAADRNHVAAERLEEEGQDLLGQNTAASMRAALEKFQPALAYYSSSSDRYRLALTAYTCGYAYEQLGDFPTSLEYYSKALPLFHDLGEANMEGTTLNNMGGAYDVLGEKQRALDSYGKFLDLPQSHIDQSTQAFVLNNIGKIYADMADVQKANDYYNQALPRFQAIGDKVGRAQVLQNIGANYNDLGEPAKGLDYLQQALALEKETGDKRMQAETLTHIGASYTILDETDKAIPTFAEALQLARSAGDHWREGQILKEMGAAYSSSGQQDKALDSLQGALTILRATQDRYAQAVTLTHIGKLYEALREPQKAIQTYTQALELSREIEDPEHMARSLLGMAQAQSDLGNLAEAQTNAEQALKLVESVRARAGGEEARASYFATQQNAYEFYIALLMKLHQRSPSAGYDAQAFSVSERARARGLLEMLAETHVDFREGVDPVLFKRERELVELLDAKANRLMGVGGGATREQNAGLKKDIDDLETQYQQLEVEIRQKSPRYAALTQPQPLSLQDIQRSLDSDTSLLQYALGSEHSYLWLVTASDVKSYELAKRTEIENSVRQLYQLLTARSTYPRGELPDQRKARIAQSDEELPGAAQNLSRMVLLPAAGDLKYKRLVIVADGALQHVPFAMLPIADANGESIPLVVAHELVNLPSASTIAALRREYETRKLAPRMLAVLADPVFDARDPRVKSTTAGSKTGAVTSVRDLGERTRILEHLSGNDSGGMNLSQMFIPRLPYTREEAARILDVAPKGENFEALDFRANLATATGPDLGNYRYLHFATHGYLDSEHPELSAIVLSLVDQAGNPQPGFLRVSDIYNLKLPAELVVLSACQTGLGKEIRGEGIVGLTRAFMYAGASRIVVSLWSVNDKATEDLMSIFYQGLLKQGLTPSAALRKAQVEMWKNKTWSNPYYWAAFVQQGEWR